MAPPTTEVRWCAFWCFRPRAPRGTRIAPVSDAIVCLTSRTALVGDTHLPEILAPRVKTMPTRLLAAATRSLKVIGRMSAADLAKALSNVVPLVVEGRGKASRRDA